MSKHPNPDSSVKQARLTNKLYSAIAIVNIVILVLFLLFIVCMQ